MKLYLSSYKLGTKTDQLKRLVPKGRIGYVANALDFSGANVERRASHIQADVQSLEDLPLEVSQIDLREYFGKKDALRRTVDELGALFVIGGNVFVLRQAMHLSGLDSILLELRGDDRFLYAGYSAAGCVLAPTLKAYEIVDKPQTPYAGLTQVIWDGLSIVDFAFMPHWDSDHPESQDIEREIAYCRLNNIPYAAVRDGEVLIIPDPS